MSKPVLDETTIEAGQLSFFKSSGSLPNENGGDQKGRTPYVRHELIERAERARRNIDDDRIPFWFGWVDQTISRPICGALAHSLFARNVDQSRDLR